MQKERDTLVLYSSAVCNLNCIYCAIDKNPALQGIDKLLEKSFEGNYYIDFIKEIFPDPQQLKTVEVWGGETFIGLSRIIPTLEKIIGIYPNFNTISISTNMTIQEWIFRFDELICLFKRYPDRIFNVTIQMSLDGPTELNDHNRGKGTTAKLIDTMETMVRYCNITDLQNVYIKTHFKPTLTIEDIQKYLSSKEDIINYYLFFEEQISKIKAVNKDNLSIYPSIPNTACPAPHTQEEGFIFRDFCKMCWDITQENKRTKIFKYYSSILPFSAGMTKRSCTNCNMCGGMCGAGFNVIGLLPNNIISCCHSGFANFLEDYKERAKKNKLGVLDQNVFTNSSPTCLIFNKEGLKDFELRAVRFYSEGTTANMVNLAIQIEILAWAGQIDQRYTNESEAIRAANYIFENTSNCVRDNLAITGSMVLRPFGLLKLLLNGARDYLDKNNYV